MNIKYTSPRDMLISRCNNIKLGRIASQLWNMLWQLGIETN